MGKEKEPPILPDQSMELPPVKKKKLRKKDPKFCLPDEVISELDKEQLIRQGEVMPKETKEKG